VPITNTLSSVGSTRTTRRDRTFGECDDAIAEVRRQPWIVLERGEMDCTSAVAPSLLALAQPIPEKFKPELPITVRQPRIED
jgi:hypothetical protein